MKERDGEGGELSACAWLLLLLLLPFPINTWVRQASRNPINPDP